MKSWKTTLSGVAALAALAVKHFWPQYAPLADQAMTVAVAGGLLAARDNNVTSEDAGLKK